MSASGNYTYDVSKGDWIFCTLPTPLKNPAGIIWWQWPDIQALPD
jgi:hypothetical protein